MVAARKQTVEVAARRMLADRLKDMESREEQLRLVVVNIVGSLSLGVIRLL